MRYPQEKVNLHTHSFYCGHSTGEIADYANEAVQGEKLSVLGMPEHCPVPDNRWSSVRMQYDRLPQHIADVRKTGEDYPQLRVLLGAECDFKPEYSVYYQDELFGKRGFDYLIGSLHFFDDEKGGAKTYLSIRWVILPLISPNMCMTIVQCCVVDCSSLVATLTFFSKQRLGIKKLKLHPGISLLVPKTWKSRLKSMDMVLGKLLWGLPMVTVPLIP
ncbi:MAG: PHP domain-containing protein [Sphaerochaetaceae bacterium]